MLYIFMFLDTNVVYIHVSRYKCRICRRTGGSITWRSSLSGRKTRNEFIQILDNSGKGRKWSLIILLRYVCWNNKVDEVFYTFMHVLIFSVNISVYFCCCYEANNSNFLALVFCKAVIYMPASYVFLSKFWFRI